MNLAVDVDGVVDGSERETHSAIARFAPSRERHVGSDGYAAISIPLRGLSPAHAHTARIVVAIDAGGATPVQIRSNELPLIAPGLATPLPS